MDERIVGFAVLAVLAAWRVRARVRDTLARHQAGALPPGTHDALLGFPRAAARLAWPARDCGRPAAWPPYRVPAGGDRRGRRLGGQGAGLVAPFVPGAVALAGLWLVRRSRGAPPERRRR